MEPLAHDLEGEMEGLCGGDQELVLLKDGGRRGGGEADMRRGGDSGF